ncbi:hypothetical protein F4861DRAFT_440902 [Xylaria intraflava]|nr:hypothetical protein F4861DRAFT_440902 [Xylaria intraflava]
MICSNSSPLITALIENYNLDPPTFRQIQATIQNIVHGSSGGYAPQPSMSSSSSHSTSNGYGYTLGKSTYEPGGSGRYQFATANHSNQPLSGYGATSTGGGTLSYYKNGYQSLREIQFKPSPFYDITSRIGDAHTCDVMTQHRNTIHISIRMSEHPTLTNLANKSYRIMMFCAGDNSGVQDIAFPHQSEFKVNGGEVKANLRGLKGKPGTTRPVDITDLLRLKPLNYNNNVEFTYALTTKVKKHDPPEPTKFYLMAYLCKMVSVDELVNKIRGKKIAKHTVIKEMDKKANDPDVVATSTVLSLKCPLSYTRLRTPCRSMLCNHIQCFDATSYLQLQEQGPQWICPICNKSAQFETLAIDEYVKDILEKTKDSIEQVTIEPNGQWTTQPIKSAAQKSRAPDPDIDVDEEVSVLADNTGNLSGTPQASSTPHRTFMASGTTGPGSKESSSAPRSGSKKRPAAEVIDLTFSSDEDDSPLVRPIKKQNVGPSTGLNNHNSFHAGHTSHY